MSKIKCYDKFGRTVWNYHFMALAFLISRRSIDPDTKHGAIVIADDKTILSTGYNGPPRGCIDENIPLTRPEKYDYMAHAEENAILNAAKHGIALDNSVFYITGYPCSGCIRKIINVGAKKVYYGPIQSTCTDKKDRLATKTMLVGPKLVVSSLADSKTIEIVTALLEDTIGYLGNKTRK